MRTLVVGADGFIGHRTLVIGGGGGFGQDLLRFLKEPVLYEGDIREVTSLDQAVRNHNVRTIINLAGVLRGAPEEMMSVHVEGAKSLAAVANLRSCIIVSAGSAAEYGVVPPTPVAEDFACEPISIYGQSKHIATQVLGPRSTIFRPSNVIGPGMSSDLLLGNVIAQLKRGATSIEVSGLHTIRDYIDVRDVASAIVCLMSAPPGIYNVSSGVGTSTEALLEILRQICDLHFEVEVDAQSNQSSDLDVFIADSTKLQSLGWQPRYSLEESVRATWEAS